MKFLKSIFRGLFSEEITSFQEQIQSNQKALAEKDQTINKYKKEKKNFTSQIAKYKHDVFNLERQVNNLHDALAHSDKEISEKKERIGSLQEQIQSKLKALTEKDCAIEQLRKEKHYQSSQIKAYHQEIISLKEQVNELRQKLSANEADLNLRDQEITVLGKRVSELQTESKNDKQRIEDYRQATEVLGNGKIVLEQSVDRLKAQLREQVSKIEQLESRIKSANEHNETLIDQKVTFERKIEELERKLSDSQRKCEDQKKELITISENLRIKEHEVRELQESVNSYEENIGLLTNSLSERNERINSLTSQKEGLESEKQALLAQLKALQKDSIEERVVNALKNDIKQKQETILLLESDIQRLNEELSSTRDDKSNIEFRFSEKSKECNTLEAELRSLSAKLDETVIAEKRHTQAEKRIAELENILKNAPTINELIKRDKEIERLKSKVREYEIRIAELVAPTPKGVMQEPNEAGAPTSGRPRYRKLHFPYRKKPIAPSTDVVTVDFPVIENDNVYSQTSRLIDKVFNHRSNSFITANDIFLHKSVEEISRMRVELEEASRTGVPYLTCPCCGNMVKISSRSVGFGLKSKEVQFFTHAVKNIVCDLKRDASYTTTIADGDGEENDFSYLKELRELLANSLRTELSQYKGLSHVEDCVYINSDELPIMKRRRADVAARYNDIDIVFELVTPTTHVARVHDRDIFYMINHRQVFWIFGLEAIVDYNELRRSVSKDILFTNKRNVFVFDLEAQKESVKRGELILKCNWLDEEGEWYYRKDKNGTNGILISLDQIHFEQDSCRPYFYDADEPFYLKHPTAERPLKLSREKLKQDIIDAWKYEQQRKQAIEEMLRGNRGVEAYSDGEKWGFKYGDIVFIEPIFDSKPIMMGDFAKVEKDGKYGVINRFGDYRLKTEYDNLILLQNGYILYASKGNWYLFGVIEPLTSFATDDEVVVSTISQSASIYHLIIKKYLFKGQQPEAFYFFGNEIFKRNSSSGKWSLWQSNGEKVTDISWDSLEFTSDETIKVSSNGRTQLLALDGTVIDEQKYKSESKLANGFSIVESFDGQWGIIDINGIEVVGPQYDSIISLDGNFIKFQERNRWGIMDSTGRKMAEPIYLSVDDFDGEKFAVTKLNDIKGWGHLSGYVDQNGKPVSEFIARTENGTSITKSFEKYGLEKGSVILIPHIYDSLFYWGENKYTAQRDGKFGIIDTQNEVFLDFEYSSITPLKDGRSTIKKGDSQHEIDSNLRKIEDEVIDLHDGYKKIKLDGKWGVLNPHGEVIVDYHYDEITTFRGRLIGIINGRLVKLNAYYPYRLAMKVENLGLVESRDLMASGGVKFQSFNKRKTPIIGQVETVILLNWTSSMRYPLVHFYDKGKHNKRARHLDKSTDFTIGDTFEVTVKSVIMGYGVAKGKIKGVEITLSNGMASYIFKKDFNASGIDISTVKVGDSFNVTKLGYDEELDRTQWKVSKI